MKTNEKSNLRSDEEREKQTNFTQCKHTIKSPNWQKIPQKQENPKDSNEPFNLGPKRDKAEFELIISQSLK